VQSGFYWLTRGERSITLDYEEHPEVAQNQIMSLKL